jgi:hypothetical protein
MAAPPLRLVGAPVSESRRASFSVGEDGAATVEVVLGTVMLDVLGPTTTTHVMLSPHEARMIGQAVTDAGWRAMKAK